MTLFYDINDKPPSDHGFIYKLTSPSGKAYIGQTTKSVHTRFSAHCRARKAHACPALSNALTHYGARHFKLDILACVSIGTLDSAEIDAIATHNTLSPHGYNVKRGGHNSWPTKKASANQCRTGAALVNIRNARALRPRTPSAACLERAWVATRGKKRDPTVVAIISSKLRGRKHTETAVANMRIGDANRVYTPEGKARCLAAHLGKKRSPETCAKIKAAAIIGRISLGIRMTMLACWKW